MHRREIIYSLLILAIYPISLLLAFFCNPAPIANIIGLFALFAYVATLLPSLIKTIFPNTKKNLILAWLLKYRRYLGITAFSLGFNHGILLIIKLQLNLLDFHTYIRYFQGFFSLSILSLLAFTSNDDAVKTLKTKWKKLHQLTYLIIFVFPWHILDKMSGHWTYITPIAVLITLVIAGLFIVKQYKEKFSIT